MKYRTQISSLIQRIDSGLFIPSGVQQDSTGYESTGLLVIKERAEAIQKMYADEGIVLPPQCGLADLIEKAKTTAGKWMLNRDRDVPPFVQLLVTHFGCMADNILSLAQVHERHEYLCRLTSGALDNVSPGESIAKSTLWELELWSSFAKRGVNVRLQDPPDILMSFDGYEVAIACKKIYSEKHVQNILSEAVRQINREQMRGLVALNIDETGPVGKVLCGHTAADACEALHRQNMEFMGRHERHLRKYLSAERLLGALISSGCVTDLDAERTRLNFTRMHTIWCLPDQSPEQAACLSAVRKALRN